MAECRLRADGMVRQLENQPVTNQWCGADVAENGVLPQYRFSATAMYVRLLA
jgi:hypothetical protein